MVGLGGVEPPTSRLSGVRSNHLSYRPFLVDKKDSLCYKSKLRKRQIKYTIVAMKRKVQVILARPRGFCAGVERAINIVEKALDKYGVPVYVRHEIVHNKFVVNALKDKGAIFVDELSEVPEGAVTIFSAHGVADAVENEAQKRNLAVIDATCPLVTKVHLEAKKYESNQYQIIIIGHKGHPEVEGTSGKVKQEVLIVSSEEDVKKLLVKDPRNLAYVTQTTLSVDDTKNIIMALKRRFPEIHGPDLRNICYATQNRQDAVKKLSGNIDLLLVIGAKNSSNSNRLRDLGEEMGIEAYLIDDVGAIDPQWFVNIQRIGVTAGASAPEVLVENVLKFLSEYFDATVSVLEGIDENIQFKLPKQLQ